MKIRIGFSTCPNDTYIFDALINGRIESDGLIFDPFLADVEELNEMAIKGELDVTKLSYHAYGHVSHIYTVLNSGSALGWGNGPLVVSRVPVQADQLDNLKIAIPGELTTANYLMAIAYPRARRKQAYLFSDIESVVLSGEADVGVLIHENRFTYGERGLHFVMDLGAFWEKKTSFPIPLGGIVAHRRLTLIIRQKIQSLIRESLLYARDNPKAPVSYVKKYAQNLREDILEKHIATFVTDYSLSLGTTGHQAIMKLLHLGSEIGLFPEPASDIFVSSVD
ncbi:MAG: 1,4-dihydroxy-6-naphthoate synthase [Bacteroidales bacterium]|nr:1,4-dihydroxy-6-naphthoate synthase [Bacteroidales bacterium]